MESMKLLCCFHFWMFALYNLPVTTGQSQLICSSQPVTACVGDDVIIPCRLDPPISATSRAIEWTRPGLDPGYVHVHQDGRLVYQSQNPLFNYRTVLFVDQLINGNVSLKLLRVKTSDSGRYKCFIPSLWREAFVQVTVREEGDVSEDKWVKVSHNFYTAITISGIFGIIAGSVIVLMVWKWRQSKKGRKNKKEDREGEGPREQLLKEDLETKLKLSEESQRKDKEEFRETLMVVTRELDKQKENLTLKMLEAEKVSEEHDRKVRSVEEEVSEKKDSKEKKVQGYLKMREICWEAVWNHENRKKELQQLFMTTDKLMKMTMDGVKKYTEMNNREENNTE